MPWNSSGSSRIVCGLSRHRYTRASPAGSGSAQTATLIPAVALWGGAAVRQALNWRSARGDRRQQLKWLALGSAAAITGAVLTAAGSFLGHFLGWFGFAVLPVSIGVGILRYRLYDIDRIISRTLAYTIVTGLLVVCLFTGCPHPRNGSGVYTGLVLLATRVVPISSPVAVAAATLTAAALFNPLRQRVQRMVDRRFNRARYDADQTVAAFAVRLKDAVDLDSIQHDLAGAVHQALEPAHVSVWVSRRN